MTFSRTLGTVALSAFGAATLGALTLGTVVSAVTGVMPLLTSPTTAAQPRHHEPAVYVLTDDAVSPVLKL